MSTSGTYTFALNRDQLITSALRKVSAFESGETPDAAAVNEASDALNTMVKHWQGAGIEIWTTEEAVLFPVAGQMSYVLGLTSADRAAGPYVQTALTSAAVATASTIVVDSVTGIATTYIIGIVLDDGTLQWTTVNGAPSGTTLTLTAALTGAAAAGNSVFVYPAELVRPLRIVAARRHNLTSKIDVPLSEMGRIEYQDMPNKTTESAVNSYYYDRRGGSESNGLIYLWPAPADLTEVIKLTVALPIQDFTAAGNAADFPPEWTRAIVWGLADELADEYDVPEPKRTRIERRATQYLDEVNWWERELGSIQFAPDTSR